MTELECAIALLLEDGLLNCEMFSVFLIKRPISVFSGFT